MEDKGLQNAGVQGKNANNYGKFDHGIWKEYFSVWITNFLGKTNTINEILQPTWKVQSCICKSPRTNALIVVCANDSPEEPEVKESGAPTCIISWEKKQ